MTKCMVLHDEMLPDAFDFTHVVEAMISTDALDEFYCYLGNIKNMFGSTFFREDLIMRISRGSSRNKKNVRGQPIK